MSPSSTDLLFQPLSFSHGPAMKNRFYLAPLTNTQSHADGRLSDEEEKWLSMRAKGGFGATMTCAAHVQAAGQGFAGQLGIFSDSHTEGLTRLAQGIREQGSLAIVQLHHAGMRSPAELIGRQPICPSDNEETKARAMTNDEIHILIEDFVAAAKRAQKCGFDGVQVHGAHGYILGQFLSAEINKREDEYGGSIENRGRIIFEIIVGIREHCGENFQIGLRLSPERFGQKLSECLEVAQKAMDSAQVDSLDMSLWDVEKEPNEKEFQGRLLRDYFSDLKRGKTRLGLAGKIASAAHAERCLREGYDFVSLGRAAILHHDFPLRAKADPNFEMCAVPVSEEYLRTQGLSDAFIAYMKRWEGFVS